MQDRRLCSTRQKSVLVVVSAGDSARGPSPRPAKIQDNRILESWKSRRTGLHGTFVDHVIRGSRIPSRSGAALANQLRFQWGLIGL